MQIKHVLNSVNVKIVKIMEIKITLDHKKVVSMELLSKVHLIIILSIKIFHKQLVNKIMKENKNKSLLKKDKKSIRNKYKLKYHRY